MTSIVRFRVGLEHRPYRDHPLLQCPHHRRFDELSEASVQHLWNSSAGCFYNKDSGTNASIERVTPNQFYPLLAGKRGVRAG